jgi:hypothetical protein
MAEQASFPYWQKRISETPDAENLSATVQDAVQAMLAEHKVGDQACADLSGMIIAFINKKSDLSDKKIRATKALTPFSLLPKPKAGAAAGAGAAMAAAAVAAVAEPLAKPEPKPEAAAPAPAAKPEPKPEAAEPAPAQAEPEETEEEAPAEQQVPAGPGFEELLIKYLAKHVLLRLKPFQLPDTGGDPQPYIFSEKFANRFSDAIQKYIGPEVIKNRRIRNMGTSVNPAELNDAYFEYQFSLSEKENTVRTLWLELMNTTQGTVRMEQTSRKKKKKGKGAKGEKKGFLAKLGLKKSEEPAVGGGTGPKVEWPMKFWDAVTKPAKEDNYSPPKLDDFGFFQVLFDYKLDDIKNSLEATAQIMEEEYQSGEPGATRRFICDRVDMYPDYCGELIALWAYFSHPAEYIKQVHKSFVASQGRSDGERKARLLFYLRWTENPIGKDEEVPAEE